MPEGDTILRAAMTLRTACLGQEVNAVGHVDRELKPSRFEQSVRQQAMVDVEARGKHLLMRFASETTLHSHMGMTGSWHIYELGQPWRKPEKRAAVSLEFSTCVAVCFSPKVLELLSTLELKRHGRLHRLGPDMLAASFDANAVLLRMRIHDAVPLGEAVLNQTVVCGIGNVYKSEMLFLEKLDPFAPVGRYSDESLLSLLATTRQWMQRNLSGQARRTRPQPSASRMWVYGRQGRPCFACGTGVQMRRQGDLGRSTYWCPSCQAVD